MGETKHSPPSIPLSRTIRSTSGLIRTIAYRFRVLSEEYTWVFGASNTQVTDERAAS